MEGFLSADDFEDDGTRPDGTRDEEHDAAGLCEVEGSDVVYAGLNGVGGGPLLSPEEGFFSSIRAAPRTVHARRVALPLCVRVPPLL